jgi:potassium/hydrogen antiporter
LPPGFLIILIARGPEFKVPSGGTKLEPGDTLLVLTEEKLYQQVMENIGRPQTKERDVG